MDSEKTLLGLSVVREYKVLYYTAIIFGLLNFPQYFDEIFHLANAQSSIFIQNNFHLIYLMSEITVFSP